MSRLDDELFEAAEAVETSSSDEAAPPVVGPPAGRSRSKRNIGLLIGLLVMGGGILTLVMTSFNNAAIYSKGVDELLAQKTKLASRNVRVAGTLVKGTLVKRDQPCEYRFKMEKNGKVLAVRYAECIVPDTFRDRPETTVQVTAEGKLTKAGYFEASQIMAKCPSKYQQKQQAQDHQKMPTVRRTRGG